MLPSAPTVTLHILPPCLSPGASDTVTLLCSTSGYYPRGLHLTWQAGGKEREGTQLRLLQGKDGRFSFSSNLTTSQAEWDELGEYSCHVTHPGTGSPQLSTISKYAGESAPLMLPWPLPFPLPTPPPLPGPISPSCSPTPSSLQPPLLSTLIPPSFPTLHPLPHLDQAWSTSPCSPNPSLLTLASLSP
ncbi:hypothetical protein KIL84_009950 [Mauremys mutica]|uniref:Ig-like domain-containing protein n=1 Tax=Mauremys mutica TaxID=74926 RepID=A0A9D3XMI4_9SAUR|nr:hypothetical protein KIL84_009950 [Mauremys mutica]